jgi:hypothetical protein
MGTKGLVGIGVALIFGLAVHGAWMGRHRDAPPEGDTEFTWLPAAHGRPAGFAMILNPPAWSWVTEHHAASMTNVLLNDQVHRRLAALVEKGMEPEADACPGRWLLAMVLPMAGGGMFFSGWCASAAELQTEDDDLRVAI